MNSSLQYVAISKHSINLALYLYSSKNRFEFLSVIAAI
jgi:hypothetical protein